MAHFLHQIFKPENFTAAEMQLILQQYEEVHFSKGDFLIEQGKTTNYYYFLERGFLRSCVIDLEGNDITTKFFSTGAIVIDWNSYFLKKPSREDVQAITDGTCWKITFENFMKLFHLEPFREVGRTRLIKNYFELKNHTVSVIADPAKERYLQLIQSTPELVQNVPLKHIATYLGITDTSLSRIRKEITS